ncbi:MAG: permease [Bacillota bacterium]
MRLVQTLKRNKLLLIALIAYVAAFLLDAGIFRQAVANTWVYVSEMLQILPAVFVLSALITVWVPAEVIMQNFGTDSGVRGRLISVLIGSLSAGPIYAAFPLTQSLLRKGASLANVVIIISAWAVVKLPMLIVEGRFLGISFAAARYLFTVPAILLIGYLVARCTTRAEVLRATAKETSSASVREHVLRVLPGHDCGACGFGDCASCAAALAEGEVGVEICVVADDETREEISAIL